MRSLTALLLALLVLPLAAQEADLPPAQLLRSALDYTRTARSMKIKATIEVGGKPSTVEASLSGKDFDVLAAPQRSRSVGAQNWTSSDGGKTWKAGERDEALVKLLRSPLEAPKGQPEIAKVGEDIVPNGKEQERLVHLQLKVDDRTQDYWVGWTQTKKPLLRRYQGPAPAASGTQLDVRYGFVNAAPAIEVVK